MIINVVKRKTSSRSVADNHYLKATEDRRHGKFKKAAAEYEAVGNKRLKIAISPEGKSPDYVWAAKGFENAAEIQRDKLKNPRKAASLYTKAAKYLSIRYAEIAQGKSMLAGEGMINRAAKYKREAGRLRRKAAREKVGLRGKLYGERKHEHKSDRKLARGRASRKKRLAHRVAA